MRRDPARRARVRMRPSNSNLCSETQVHNAFRRTMQSTCPTRVLSLPLLKWCSPRRESRSMPRRRKLGNLDIIGQQTGSGCPTIGRETGVGDGSPRSGLPRDVGA